ALVVEQAVESLDTWPHAVRRLQHGLEALLHRFEAGGQRCRRVCHAGSAQLMGGLAGHPPDLLKRRALRLGRPPPLLHLRDRPHGELLGELAAHANEIGELDGAPAPPSVAALAADAWPALRLPRPDRRIDRLVLAARRDETERGIATVMMAMAARLRVRRR